MKIALSVHQLVRRSTPASSGYGALVFILVCPEAYGLASQVIFPRNAGDVVSGRD